jgi:arylsulfatase A-like enzyme
MVEKTWVEGERFGIRRGGWKYIARASGLDGELYDLRADPSEAENVRRLHPDRAADLGRQLAAFTLRTAQPEVEARPLSQEDRRGLEALGYAQ